jgi:Na+-transporting NADH:ubiquinone oxidoreductase subunit C
MARDSTARLLTVALVVCLVCSICVSVAAVVLRERQDENRAIAKKEAILRIARLYDPARPVGEQFERITPRMLDLDSGWFIDGAGSGGTIAIAPEQDIAGISQRPRYRELYLVNAGGRLEQIILPVYGKGLWSTMYGYIALGSDCTTITGFGFYEHGETPGLGGEIDNPRWLGLWPGKRVYDEAGTLRIGVVKGSVDATSPDARYRVDGLSGATLTARGVSNLLAYWLGDQGYGPFLARMRTLGGKLP